MAYFSYSRASVNDVCAVLLSINKCVWCIFDAENCLHLTGSISYSCKHIKF
ncbi:hypothetical protein APHMUC_0275 [Anaplasma phagocytophilum str. ApMUC09]|uniref:Uncharacterized protein n=1 Tax=Anaplasma phagocytophilum str. ApMUC09 TaxID=1359152 RepID=A0A0F3N7V6_ANAPH|nr:hypothetical protein APHMUC_0275 [Anaplasma phagocytophilum str. ApMUC09]